MNRRIEVSLARYGWDVDEERVTVTTASGTTVLYDADDGTGDEQVASEYIDAALAEGPWLLRFAGTPGDFPVGAGTASAWATYRSLTDIGRKFTLTAVDEDAPLDDGWILEEEVGPMNPLRMARALRAEFANGTCDIEEGLFWFDPASALGSLLRTTPETGHFDVAATLVGDMLVLNPRLTEFLTDACPAWSEVFDMAAGRLVIMDAALMTGDTIERLEALRVREAVAA